MPKRAFPTISRKLNLVDLGPGEENKYKGKKIFQIDESTFKEN